MYVHIYIYMFIYTCIYIYIYTHMSVGCLRRTSELAKSYQISSVIARGISRETCCLRQPSLSCNVASHNILVTTSLKHNIASHITLVHSAFVKRRVVTTSYGVSIVAEQEHIRQSWMSSPESYTIL